MPSTDIAALGVKVDFTQVTSAIDALNRLKAASAGVSTVTAAMTQATTPANMAMSSMAKMMGGGYVPAATAAAAATAAVTTATAALTKAVAPAVQAHQSLIAASSNAVVAHKAHGGAMMQSRFAAMEFEHSIRAIIDGLGAGMSPMRLFAMEGSRLAQAYQMGGGASGVISMFGGIVSKVLNPTVLLTGALAGLGAVGVGAFSAWEARLGAMQNALNGLGRSTGLTLSSLNNAALGAAGGRTSIGQAQNAVAAFAATGQIGPGLMSNIISTPQLAYGSQQSTLQRYATATGSSFSDATKTLAGDFADPVKGAEALQKQFGSLDDATMQLIRNLEASGQHLQAQTVLFGALQEGLHGATDRTWSFARAWDGVTTAVSNAFSAIGGAIQRVVDPDLTDRYASALQGYQHYRRGTIPGDIMSGQVEDLGEQMRRRGQGASTLARTTNANAASEAAGATIRSIVGDIQGRQSLLNQRNSLSTALNTPGVRGSLDPDTANAADDALARLTAGITTFASAAQKVTQDSTFAAQAIQAETAQQRTAIEALRSFNDVMRESHDGALAAATATAKWNEAIATSNKQAEDALRSAQENSATAGMRPYQRSRAEIDYRYRNLSRESVTGPVSSLDGAFTALDDRTTPLARAMLLGSKGSNSYLDAAGTLGISGGKLTNRVVPTVHAADPFADHFSVPLGSMAYDYGGAPSSDVTVSGGRRIGSYAPAAASFAPGNIRSTSGGSLSQARQLDLTANDVTQIVIPLREAQDAIDAQNRLLAVQRQTWGQMPTVITEATEKTKLLNDEIARGVPISGTILAANQRVAAGAADIAKQQMDLQNRADAQNSFREIGSQFVGGAANDIFSTWNSNPRDLIGQLSTGDQMKYYAGQMSGNQVKDKIRGKQISDLFASIMEKQGVNLIETGLFGNGKQGNNGILGGLFGALTGGLFGGGGAAATGAATGGGGLFGGIAKLFGFADGGIMTPSGPLKLARYASGGVTSGPQIALSGERGPEAYIPLPDGRSVPVAMKGGGRAPQISLGGHTIIVQGNADEKTAAMMDAKLAAANSKMLNDLQRNIGPMVAKYNQRNG